MNEPQLTKPLTARPLNAETIIEKGLKNVIVTEGVPAERRLVAGGAE